MIMMFMITVFIFLVLIIMLFINLILSKKSFKNREKMSPFECGFDPMSKLRLPFSLQFYLITIIFLIFDIEISMILPLIKSNSFNYYYINYNFNIIIMILLMGLYLEWKEGAFKWFK